MTPAKANADRVVPKLIKMLDDPDLDLRLIAAQSLERYGPVGAPVASLLACRLETGRTHQIRVHMRAIGHPVVGDPRYGGARAALEAPRPFLHAHRLTFVHPGTGEPASFSSPLPPDLAAVLRRVSST